MTPHALSRTGSRTDSRTGRPDELIRSAVANARHDLGKVASASSTTFDGAGCRDLLLEITALASQVAELELRVLHQAERVQAGQKAGARSAATWLAVATRQTRRSTHAKSRLAAAVAENPTVREAMALGELLPEQARAILDEVALLPGDRSQATSELVSEAGRAGAAELRVRGREVAAGPRPTREAASPDVPADTAVTRDADADADVDADPDRGAGPLSLVPQYVAPDRQGRDDPAGSASTLGSPGRASPTATSRLVRRVRGLFCVAARLARLVADLPGYRLSVSRAGAHRLVRGRARGSR